jgi:hypothetical protein
VPKTNNPVTPTSICITFLKRKGGIKKTIADVKPKIAVCDKYSQTLGPLDRV